MTVGSVAEPGGFRAPGADTSQLGLGTIGPLANARYGVASCTMTTTAQSPVITFPVTSAFELPGMRVERSLGITFGLVVRSMGFSKAVTGGISSLRQGEISQFTVVLEDARRHAIDRMIENAKLLGANAVIAMRFDSSEIGKARAEVVAYGTAVVAATSA
jgi:uncharacterized protein YbjQ (UPF0145 family)